MFTNTIDKKPFIVDNNNNVLVDLTKSIFDKSAHGLNSYNTVKLSSYYQMRPDKVAFSEYGTDEYTEYILKYSGVSNPFSMDQDDILFIPDPTEAKAQMQDTINVEQESKKQVQAYYKFTNTDYKSSDKTYNDLANKKIQSGVLNPDENGGFTVPYISDQGSAITIKNGRMYFGTDAGDVAMPDNKNLATKLDEKCAINGMSLTDFVRASIVNAGKKE